MPQQCLPGHLAAGHRRTSAAWSLPWRPQAARPPMPSCPVEARATAADPHLLETAVGGWSLCYACTSPDAPSIPRAHSFWTVGQRRSVSIHTQPAASGSLIRCTDSGIAILPLQQLTNSRPHHSIAARCCTDHCFAPLQRAAAVLYVTPASLASRAKSTRPPCGCIAALRDVADDCPQLDLSLVGGLDLLHGVARSESMACSRLVPVLWTPSTIMQVAKLAKFGRMPASNCVARLPHRACKSR